MLLKTIHVLKEAANTGNHGPSLMPTQRQIKGNPDMLRQYAEWQAKARLLPRLILRMALVAVPLLGAGCIANPASIQAVGSTKIARDTAQLERLEMKRCQAISTVNIQALNDVLADEYVHVHSVGLVNSKAEFIAGIQERPRGVERGPLTIRVYGDMAIITGEQRNVRATFAPAEPSPSGSALDQGARPGTGRFFATQVARRAKDGQWRFVTMHVTSISGPGLPESTPTSR